MNNGSSVEVNAIEKKLENENRDSLDSPKQDANDSLDKPNNEESYQL